MWEYLIIDEFGEGKPNQERLDYLGKNGWELVTVFQPSMGVAPRYYFKREKRIISKREAWLSAGL